MYSYRYRYYHSRSGIFYFNGEDIDEWLNQLESYFIKSQIDEHRKLDVATGHLTGQALDWYHQWNQKRLQRWLQIWTWTDFVRDLKLRFKPPEPVQSQSEILESISKRMDELRQSIMEMKAQNLVYTSSVLKLKPHPDSNASSDISVVQEYSETMVEVSQVTLDSEVCTEAVTNEGETDDDNFLDVAREVTVGLVKNISSDGEQEGSKPFVMEITEGLTNVAHGNSLLHLSKVDSAKRDDISGLQTQICFLAENENLCLPTVWQNVSPSLAAHLGINIHLFVLSLAKKPPDRPPDGCFPEFSNADVRQLNKEMHTSCLGYCDNEGYKLTNSVKIGVVLDFSRVMSVPESVGRITPKTAKVYIDVDNDPEFYFTKEQVESSEMLKLLNLFLETKSEMMIELSVDVFCKRHDGTEIVAVSNGMAKSFCFRTLSVFGSIRKTYSVSSDKEWVEKSPDASRYVITSGKLFVEDIKVVPHSVKFVEEAVILKCEEHMICYLTYKAQRQKPSYFCASSWRLVLVDGLKVVVYHRINRTSSYESRCNGGIMRCRNIMNGLSLVCLTLLTEMAGNLQAAVGVDLLVGELWVMTIVFIGNSNIINFLDNFDADWGLMEWYFVTREVMHYGLWDNRVCDFANLKVLDTFASFSCWCLTEFPRGGVGFHVIAKMESATTYSELCLSDYANKQKHFPVELLSFFIGILLFYAVTNKYGGCLMSFDPGGLNCDDILTSKFSQMSEEAVSILNTFITCILKTVATAVIAPTWAGPLPIACGQDSCMESRYIFLHGTLRAPILGVTKFAEVLGALLSHEEYSPIVAEELQCFYVRIKWQTDALTNDIAKKFVSSSRSYQMKTTSFIDVRNKLTFYSRGKHKEVQDKDGFKLFGEFLDTYQCTKCSLVSLIWKMDKEATVFWKGANVQRLKIYDKMLSQGLMVRWMDYNKLLFGGLRQVDYFSLSRPPDSLTLRTRSISRAEECYVFYYMLTLGTTLEFEICNWCLI